MFLEEVMEVSPNKNTARWHIRVPKWSSPARVVPMIGLDSTTLAMEFLLERLEVPAWKACWRHGQEQCQGSTEALKSNSIK